MNLIPNGMARSLTRQMLVAKKNSPHIFFAAGVVGVVTSAVLACRATLKLEETLDEIKEDVDDIRAKHLAVVPISSEKEYRKDLARVYVRSGVAVGKLYGPSIVVGAASIGALTGSHVQMTRRNSALTATVALVSQAFEEYRDRVRDELGEERERDLHNGVTTEKRTIDGKKVDVKIVDGEGLGPTSFMFTQQTSWNWKPEAYTNRTFLECQQNWANMRLQMRGHVILNEVLDSLGMEQTQAGCILGWVYDKNCANDGDNYVDFGIFTSEKNIEFINGSEFDVLLDFNVDGIVWDKI